MEWLKKLIENARENGNGSIDMEDLMKNINVAFPRHAVPKTYFNEVNEKLKTARKEVAIMKEDMKVMEELQKTIEENDETIHKLLEIVAITIKRQT